jgi:hypothetical protein
LWYEVWKELVRSTNKLFMVLDSAPVCTHLASLQNIGGDSMYRIAVTRGSILGIFCFGSVFDTSGSWIGVFCFLYRHRFCWWWCPFRLCIDALWVLCVDPYIHKQISMGGCLFISV